MKTNLPIIDTHFHILEMLKKEKSPEEVLAPENQVFFLLDVGVDGFDFDKRTGYTHENLYFAAGIHPCSMDLDLEEQKKLINHQVDHPRVIALGETGIDLYWSRDTLKAQKEMLHFHAQLAQDRGLPLIIHNREGDREVLEVLRGYKGQIKGIFHCFSSSPEFVRESLDLGFYYSFAGNLTYKSAKEIQKSALEVPEDRLLVETDAPYLSPVPKRGRRNTPLYAPYTLDFLATHRETLPEKLHHQIRKNIKTLWGDRINLPE